MCLYTIFILFTVPYFTSKGMLDSSKNERENGIYQAGFVAISWIGRLLYICLSYLPNLLFRLLHHFFPNVFKGYRKSTWLVILDFLVFTLGILILTFFYQIYSNPFASDTLELTNTWVLNGMGGSSSTLWGAIVSGFDFIYIGYLVFIDSFSGSLFHLPIAVFSLFRYLAYLFIVNLSYYAIVYGFIVGKMDETMFTVSIMDMKSDMARPPSSDTLQCLLYSLKEAFLDALEHMSILYRGFKNKVACGLILGFVALLAILRTVFTGNSTVLSEVILEVIPIDDFIHIIASFALTYALARVSQRTVSVCVSRLPDPLENTIISVARRCEDYVEDQHNRWDQWSDDYDVVRGNDAGSNNENRREPRDAPPRPANASTSYQFLSERVEDVEMVTTAFDTLLNWAMQTTTNRTASISPNEVSFRMATAMVQDRPNDRYYRVATFIKQYGLFTNATAKQNLPILSDEDSVKFLNMLHGLCNADKFRALVDPECFANFVSALGNATTEETCMANYLFLAGCTDSTINEMTMQQMTLFTNCASFGIPAFKELLASQSSS